MRGLLDDKDILLKEIHHRVKNNLQVIGNLLEMQAEEHSDSKTLSAFNEAKARVRSVALIHQNLYWQDDLSGIELHGFVDGLRTGIDEVFKEEGKTVTVQNNIPSMHLDIDTAVPLGLILNELLTNAYKYPFKGRSNGEIRIGLQQRGDGDYLLIFSDDGPGMRDEQLFENATTLGLRMIKRLTIQIMGHVEYTHDNGSIFTIIFKDLKVRKNVD